jgi:glycosyltransferase involved in cell wall biosynthesis
MKFLSVIDSLDPACGGPPKCALQLGRDLVNLGHEADFLTADGRDREWSRAESTALRQRTETVRILRKLPRFMRRFHRAGPNYDAIIIHGLWSLSTLALRLGVKLNRPYFLFPHGMLDPYFLGDARLKHIKKSICYRLGVVPVLERAEAVLFTCGEEMRLASISYKPVAGRRVAVRFGIEDPPTCLSPPSSQLSQTMAALFGKTKLLFLSRIHPKKGCDLLIDALASLLPAYPELHLLIVGPDEVSLVSQLKHQAKSLGVSESITWYGPTYGHDKWHLYRSAEAFVLPSHMENFGLVVAEALSAGVPALISERVNIHALVSKHQAGFTGPDTQAGAVGMIQSWMNLPKTEKEKYRANAVQLYEREFRSVFTAMDILGLLQTPRPGSIAEPLLTNERTAAL